MSSQAFLVNYADSPCWLAVPFTGILCTPPFTLGGSNIFVIGVDENDTSFADLRLALLSSFKSFGITDLKSIAISSINVLLVPARAIDEQAVRDLLMAADFLLSIVNRKIILVQADLVRWHRREGLAVGAIRDNTGWRPIENKNRSYGPALRAPPQPDIWDLFLHRWISDKQSPLEKALRTCLEWQTEAQRTANINHRFVFNWVACEALMPNDERNGTGHSKRFGIAIGAPSKFYSSRLRNDEQLKPYVARMVNPHAKDWSRAIKSMYACRCSILHEGKTDVQGEDPLKIDWFVLLAGFLAERLIQLAIRGVSARVSDVNEFWDEFVPRYLYSDANEFAQRGVFAEIDYIKYEWSTGPHPEILRQ